MNRLAGKVALVTGAPYFVDGGITVAKGAVGQKADASAQQPPAGELALEHEMDGATEQR